MTQALNVEVTGAATGPAILLIHPLGGNLHFWDECVAPLRDRFRLVACDLRGSGRSPIPVRPWTLQDHTADLEALRKELGIDRWHVVGVAVGAMLAAVYAAAHPAAVASLLLSNPSIKVQKARMLDRAALVQKGGLDAILPGAVDAAFNGMTDEPRRLGYLDLFRQNSAKGYELSMLGLLETDLTEILPRITVPTLVSTADLDRVSVPGAARAVADPLPNARLVPMPGAAHFPPFQNPAAFSALLANFVASQQPGKAN